MFRIKLIILFFFLTMGSVCAQNLAFKHLTIDDGLPSNTIFDVYFDSKGYLWIGTDKGMVRYNGIEFKTFTSNDGLPDNEIFGFNEDYEGRLWISNFKGTLCYYKDNVFHTAANTPWLRIKNKTPANYFHRLALQKDSSLILLSMNGRSLVLIKHETLKELPLDPIIKTQAPLDQFPVLSKRLDDRSLQLYYQHQLVIIDNDGKLVKRIPYKDTQTHFTITSLHDDSYLCTQKILYNYKEEKIGTLPDDGPAFFGFFRSIHISSRGNIFAGSKYGLFYNSQHLLPDYTNFTDIDSDNYGNIWASTLNDGIFYINKYFNHVFQYPTTIKEKMAASQIIGDGLTVVTESGKIYTISKKTADHTIAPADSMAVMKKPGDFFSFTRANTCITPAGDIFSLQGLNIYYKRKSDKTFKKIALQLHYQYEVIPATKAVYYYDSTFFVSTINSIWKIKTSDLKKQTLSIPLSAYLYRTQTNNRLYHSALHKADTTFFFSKANKMLYIKGNEVHEEKGLQNRTFRQFDFYGDYLLGYTDENKLYVYNVKTRYLDSLSETNCIWETLYRINDSVAIFNTNMGYKRVTFHQPVKNEKAYDLTTIENPFIPDKAGYIFGDGITYYFFKNGILSGLPAVMVTNKPAPPKPYFVSVKTTRNTFAIKPSLNISYEDSKAIIIQIDNVSFNSKELITQYSISKDINKNNWNTSAGTEISLNSIGISYGDYIIKLRSKTSASNFSEPNILTLHIAAPFWARWWFITLSALFVIGCILGIIRLMIWRQLRKKQQQFDSEMKYQQSEYKALNALMNPHFIFNSLNNIQSLINKDSKQTANQYLVIFSKLIRQNMVNISKGYISLDQELQLVGNYLNLEKLRFKNLIDFSINIDEEVDVESIMIPPLLIQPLVENAIIHGLLPMQSEDSKLIISVFEKGNVLHIDI